MFACVDGRPALTLVPLRFARINHAPWELVKIALQTAAEGFFTFPVWRSEQSIREDNRWLQIFWIIFFNLMKSWYSSSREIRLVKDVNSNNWGEKSFP